MPIERMCRRRLRCMMIFAASLTVTGAHQATALPFKPPEFVKSAIVPVQARGSLSRSFAKAAGSAVRSEPAGTSRAARGAPEYVGPAQGRTTAPTTAPAPTRRAQSATEMALGLRNEINRNRVEVNRGDGRRAVFDLSGRGHYEKSVKREIATPHKHSTIIHEGQTGRSATRTPVEPMTKQDVRTVRRVIEGRKDREGSNGR